MFKATVPNVDDEGIILVRGVPFGGPDQRDVHGQFFSLNTNFLSHILPLPPIFHFHGAKSGSLSEQIGETLAREQRGDGVYYRAKLFIDSGVETVRQKAMQLWEAAKSGKLFASSGAVEATIKVADDGEILQWLVGELSLIDTRSNRETPASFHATVIPVKAADLENVETGDMTVDDLSILTSEEIASTDIANITEDRLKTIMKSTFQQVLGTDDILTRSSDMPDENNDLLAQMQQQMTQMQQQMADLSTQNAALQTDLQARDSTIEELRNVVSTKSAEVAMGSHLGMVETWIKDGKIAPAEKDYVLEVLSFAYQADTTIKGDVGFVNAIKGWMEARPVNPVLGGPNQVYTNLNGSSVNEGPGGGIDPANVNRLAGYAEIPEDRLQRYRQGHKGG